jgi:hypothetical protein
MFHVENCVDGASCLNLDHTLQTGEEIDCPPTQDGRSNALSDESAGILPVPVSDY